MHPVERNLAIARVTPASFASFRDMAIEILYIGNGCLGKHQFLSGCLGFQVGLLLEVDCLRFASLTLQDPPHLAPDASRSLATETCESTSIHPAPRPPWNRAKGMGPVTKTTAGFWRVPGLGTGRWSSHQRDSIESFGVQAIPDWQLQSQTGRGRPGGLERSKHPSIGGSTMEDVWVGTIIRCGGDASDGRAVRGPRVSVWKFRIIIPSAQWDEKGPQTQETAEQHSNKGPILSQINQTRTHEGAKGTS